MAGKRQLLGRTTADLLDADGVLRIGVCDRMFGRPMVPQPAAGPVPAIEWDTSGTPRRVMVFTDMDLERAAEYPEAVKIAWMLESPRVTRRQYRWLAANAGKFAVVFTFSQKTLAAIPNGLFCPLGGCWIDAGQWQIGAKDANVSLIASEKKSLPGQRLRHRIVRSFGSRLDAVLGRGYRPVESKVEALGRFRYSVVVENCRADWYFSEKLIDCFACGTVPIYWGCPDVGRFFNPHGVIPFHNRWQLAGILKRIGESDYAARLEAVKDNFERAKQYTSLEAGFARTLQVFLS